MQILPLAVENLSSLARSVDRQDVRNFPGIGDGHRADAVWPVLSPPPILPVSLGARWQETQDVGGKCLCKPPVAALAFANASPCFRLIVVPPARRLRA